MVFASRATYDPGIQPTLSSGGSIRYCRRRGRRVPLADGNLSDRPTLLTLVFVPALFLVMDEISRLLAWFFGRYVTDYKDHDKPHGPRLPDRPLPAAQEPRPPLDSKAVMSSPGPAYLWR